MRGEMRWRIWESWWEATAGKGDIVKHFHSFSLDSPSSLNSPTPNNNQPHLFSGPSVLFYKDRLAFMILVKVVFVSGELTHIHYTSTLWCCKCDIVPWYTLWNIPFSLEEMAVKKTAVKLLLIPVYLPVSLSHSLTDLHTTCIVRERSGLWGVKSRRLVSFSRNTHSYCTVTELVSH